jgi:hypothetical protein
VLLDFEKEIASYIDAPIVGLAPDLCNVRTHPELKAVREAEVELWRNQNDPDSPFIVLDSDLSLYSKGYAKSHLTQINRRTGFVCKDAKQIDRLLGDMQVTAESKLTTQEDTCADHRHPAL